jgi:HD-GYP domain-containing protein (c-di-GMP phosphodiesterase class II)
VTAPDGRSDPRPGPGPDLRDGRGSGTGTASGDSARAFLVALAQALSARRLYGADHARSRDSVTAAVGRASALLSESRRPVLSLLGAEVIYGDHPLRDPGPAGLAERLSAAGVQRIELRGPPSENEMADFIGELEAALREGRHPGSPDPRRAAPRDQGAAAPPGDPANIVWGALRPREPGDGRPGSSARVPRGSDGAEDSAPPEVPDLGVEIEAISWIWEEVRTGRPLPLFEAEGVVRSLGVVLRDLPPSSAPRVVSPGDWSYGPLHAMHTALLAMAWIRDAGGTPTEIMDLGLAGLLHDVGLVLVAPNGTFEHPRALDEAERRRLETHPLEGARLLLATDARLALAAVVAFEHHLLPRGGGYPATSRTGPPHPAARLVQLLSSYDALRSERPFRPARSAGATREVLRSVSGTLFDATFVVEFERFDPEVPAAAPPDAAAGQGAGTGSGVDAGTAVGPQGEEGRQASS